MYRTGHAGAALLCYAPLGTVSLALGHERLALLGGAAAVALCMLPDVDQWIPGVAHRGPTHTVWFLLGVAAVGGLVGVLAGLSAGPLPALGLGAFGAALGALVIGSHIAADALTPMGVRPFRPYRDSHHSLDLVRAANPLANGALLLVGGVAAALALRIGTALAGL